MTVTKGLIIISEGKIASIEIHTKDGQINEKGAEMVALKNLVDEAVIELERNEQRKFIPTKDTVYTAAKNKD